MKTRYQGAKQGTFLALLGAAFFALGCWFAVLTAALWPALLLVSGIGLAAMGLELLLPPRKKPQRRNL